MNCAGSTTDLDYADFVEQLRPTDPVLAETFAAFTGLESVLNWLNGRGPVVGKVDIVGMDEFHYDFLIPLADERWAAIGVT